MTIRNVPGVGQFYKIYYIEPFPFIVTMLVSKTGSEIMGMEAVPLPPLNVFYNEKDFGGYRELSIQSLRYDNHYSQFIYLLKKQKDISSAIIEGAFVRDFYDKIIYKIIFRING